MLLTFVTFELSFTGAWESMGGLSTIPWFDRFRGGRSCSTLSLYFTPTAFRGLHFLPSLLKDSSPIVTPPNEAILVVRTRTPESFQLYWNVINRGVNLVDLLKRFEEEKGR